LERVSPKIATSGALTIGVKDVPIPFSPPLEQEVLPDKDRIVEGIKSVF